MQTATGIDDPILAECLYTFGEIEGSLDHLDNMVSDCESAVELAAFIISRSQFRATLLLAAQVKRVADALEESQQYIKAGDDHDDLSFSTKLWKVD